MNIHAQIDEWVQDGIVTAAQADRMRDDLDEPEVDPFSRKGLAFIGAVLNGALILVFTLLLELEITHTTFLLWMICIIPMVYTLRFSAMSMLMSVLFVAWIGFAVFEGASALAVWERVIQLPVMFALAGLVLFSVGGLHYAFKKFRRLARAYRLIGIQVTFAGLFAMTLRSVARGPALMAQLQDAAATQRMVVVLGGLSAVAIVATLVGIALRIKGVTPDLTRTESPIAVGLAAVAAGYYLLPLPSLVLVIGANLVMVAMCGCLLYVGYRRDDLRLVNIASIATLVLVGLRFFDFGYERLSLAAFVISGLMTLAIVAAVLEIGRRRLQARLDDSPSVEAAELKREESSAAAQTARAREAVAKGAEKLKADLEKLRASTPDP